MMYTPLKPGMSSARSALMEFCENYRYSTPYEQAQACGEIAELLNENHGIDPYKLAVEYERLKTIMPHYSSEGELMRYALESMERAVT